MKRLWQSAAGVQWIGIVLTVLWLSYVGLETGFDPAHPLFDYIFMVPIVGWILLSFRLRRLRRQQRAGLRDPSAD